MKKDFNKGLLLTSLGSFWWGFIGVIYFQYLSFIGYTELVVHRCLWTAVMLIFITAQKQILVFKRIILIFCLKILNMKMNNDGGETGIRTQERVARLPVFKTGAFNRSAISPFRCFYNLKYLIQP